MLIPETLLPHDLHGRHGRLREYFHDKDATATLVGDYWQIKLEWPDGTRRHVDPMIEAALTDWNSIPLSGMGLARQRSGSVLTALYDTWTLLSWSEWAKRAGVTADDRITVLHLDDHRDLGSPRLDMIEDGLVDMITNQPFDVTLPHTVLAACESGAIGMGSFMTPFLLAFPNCDVRQLAQPPKVTETRDWAFLPSTYSDDLLRPGHLRPAILLESVIGTGPGRYRATNKLDDWLDGIGPGPVLLHVDMDYFNNRYDGDGDWPDRHPRHDPPLQDVVSHIDEVVAALKGADVLRRVEDAVIAFSPGFFPAEMWATAGARLGAGLAELYD
ncbi:hypothetical protein [Blastomonas aquatica]|uniref:Uncharacterized protein n=1 Tax=Blastomonas aquatica TaxID=1510276 RepID=A0ABQ1JQ13_9SPHN|nr:hypothetical protein [Blastomonas aquatica]GGB72709.1 hypothetical protein GCM10010833_29860 [Blastomonas aquatica]